MAQIMEAESINQELMAGLAALFPGASAYMLDLLSYIGVFENLDTLKAAVLNIKQQIDLPQDINADDLIISILLFEQSPLAARRKVEVLKAKKAVAEISAALALDKQYIELLLNHYAALASKTLFIQEYETLCKDLPLDLTKQNPKFAAVIDTLIDQAQKQEAKTSIILQENAAFIEMLSKENGLSGLLTKNLIEIYCQNGAVALKP
ncbi:MAG: hypothetical protein LBM71_01745, partial [Elusimicrobiota bacterium]|nr:hypothetical protein [Elusimicrobiota bacterium]